jgi:oxepin-CoA hydrolase/3-oxo-5,6-dehydrosuberyl-CoA semialdehyde dehydrogenase
LNISSAFFISFTLNNKTMTQTEIEKSLERLREDSPRLFGIMTPQHMVEHLIITFKLSSGRVKIPEFIPNEKQLGYKQMLLGTDMEFPKGVRAPGLPEDVLPLRFDSLSTAKEKLLNAIEEFHTHFANNPIDLTMHPRFGKLNYDEWKIFHDKHVIHHFSQFT